MERTARRHDRSRAGAVAEDAITIFMSAKKAVRTTTFWLIAWVLAHEYSVAAPINFDDIVDPLIGSAGRGSCMPGPCLPHGSIYPGPETLRPTPAGYTANEPIVGFSQLHTQGTGGLPSYGNFLITPRIGRAVTEAEHASPKADEDARLSCYRVKLTRDDITAEVAATQHCALYRFTFPESSDAHLIIDVARKVGGAIALDVGEVKIDRERRLITGGGSFSRNWNPAPYDVYFAAYVDVAPAEVGTWKGSSIQPSTMEARGAKQSLGAYLRFETVPTRAVCLKIAVSFHSPEQALRWLDAEIPDWDFDRVRAEANAKWTEALSRVSLERASAEETRQFYTALWHSLVQPRDRTGDSTCFDPNLPLWDDHYTLWDTWKTLFPLLSIVRPEAVRDNVRAFIHRHERNPDGLVAEAFIQGKEFRVGQGGNETDNVIADAFVRGIEGVDWAKAYAVVRHHAEHARTPHYREHGWVDDKEKTGYSWRMKSGSGTLAFAYNDFLAAQMAKSLGHQADHDRFLARSGNWRNVWDDTLESDGFRGFVRARRADGTFSNTEATKGFNTDFYEGTCWEFSYDVPHDILALIEKMGGREVFIRRLLHALRNDYIAFDNEPSFMTIWWFAAVDRPYLASHWADVLRRKFSGRDLPGDDDSGAMSSLYVFLTAGFYPIAGQDIYYLHGGRVPEIRFHQTNGKIFTIISENAGVENPYVQSATLDGKPLEHALIRHRDILNGSTLRFVMGPQPSAWGANGEFDAEAAKVELKR
jgi:predicted alpha-1,2-mannosidase